LDLSSIEIQLAPNSGQAVAQGDGTIRYTPGSGFVGNDTFTYTIADLSGRVSQPATVDVRVLASRLQNPTQFRDVNDDGFVTAIDALLVINRLNRGGNVNQIPVTGEDAGPPYYDVSGDRFISAQDALLVINALNRQSRGFAGEGEAAPTGVSSSNVAPPPAAKQSDASEPTGQPISTVHASGEKIVGRSVDVELSTGSLVDEDAIGLIAAAQSVDDDEDSVDITAAIDAAMASVI